MEWKLIVIFWILYWEFISFPIFWKMSDLTFWLEFFGPEMSIWPNVNQSASASLPWVLKLDIWDTSSFHVSLVEKIWGSRADGDHISHRKKNICRRMSQKSQKITKERCNEWQIIIIPQIYVRSSTSCDLITKANNLFFFSKVSLNCISVSYNSKTSVPSLTTTLCWNYYVMGILTFTGIFIKYIQKIDNEWVRSLQN